MLEPERNQPRSPQCARGSPPFRPVTKRTLRRSRPHRVEGDSAGLTELISPRVLFDQELVDAARSFQLRS
jgi:hypothetical protein